MKKCEKFRKKWQGIENEVPQGLIGNEENLYK